MHTVHDSVARVWAHDLCTWHGISDCSPPHALPWLLQLLTSTPALLIPVAGGDLFSRALKLTPPIECAVLATPGTACIEISHNRSQLQIRRA